LLLLLLALVRTGGAADRPNVLLVLADDLGSGDPRCYRPESHVPMPALDRLAREGLRFTDAHSPSAVCTPTRYGLLTARYAWRTSLERWVLNGYSPLLIEPGRPTLASVLRAAGYRTGCFGKWHLGLGAAERTDYAAPLVPGPTTVGFDEFFGIPASLDMPPYLFVSGDRPVAPATERIEASRQRRHGGGGFWRAGPIAPGFRHDQVLPETIRAAVDFIERSAREEPRRPFLAYVPLSAPHTPWLPAERFVGASEAGPYGDFAAQVDAAIGELLAAIDRLGIAGDTLVIVTSDNGAHWTPADIERFGHRANDAWRGQKADIHEGGHRVPLLVRWPGRIPAGARCDATVGLIDVLPTIAAALDVRLPDATGADGVSFAPLLERPAAAGWTRRPLVMHSGDGMFAVRRGRWKLVLGLGSGGFTAPARREPGDGEPPGQLYDLVADPGESRNVHAEHPDVVDELTRWLEATRGQEPRRSAAAAGS
jgi:arylsulfatase A-like enzyme